MGGVDCQDLLLTVWLAGRAILPRHLAFQQRHAFLVGVIAFAFRGPERWAFVFLAGQLVFGDLPALRATCCLDAFVRAIDRVRVGRVLRGTDVLQASRSADLPLTGPRCGPGGAIGASAP
jgi:hypothetical protein